MRRKKETIAVKQDPAIIFEDDDLICVNKPPGLVVNRAQSVKEETLQDWVEKNFQFPCLAGRRAISNSQLEDAEIEKEFIAKSGIVHRIDKETSGLLLIAKNPYSYKNCKQQFLDRRIKKTYLALAHGDIPAQGEIRAPIGRLPWNSKQFGVVPGGKESLTKYKKMQNVECIMQNKKQEKISVVEVMPETGRTHQIRVHFKYIGHPLLGDYLYAGRKTSRDDRSSVGRVMLHAWKLSCLHPRTGEPLAFEAPIPDDMKRIINSKTQITKSKQILNSKF